MKENTLFFLTILALVFFILAQAYGLWGIMFFLCLVAFILGWSAKNLKDVLYSDS